MPNTSSGDDSGTREKRKSQFRAKTDVHRHRASDQGSRMDIDRGRDALQTYGSQQSARQIKRRRERRSSIRPLSNKQAQHNIFAFLSKVVHASTLQRRMSIELEDALAERDTCYRGLVAWRNRADELEEAVSERDAEIAELHNALGERIEQLRWMQGARGYWMERFQVYEELFGAAMNRGGARGGGESTLFA